LTAVGRGFDLSTAFETALKIRELAGLVAEAFSPADLLHGPVAALGRSGWVWLIAGGDPPNRVVSMVLERVRALSIPTVVVGPRRPRDDLHAMYVPVRQPVPDWVGAVLALLPGQAAALRLAERCGGDIDHPPGLEKVTLTP
jgi:glucosamine--fructose-6-phosphate aminotransferase (isomerizing)